MHTCNTLGRVCRGHRMRCAEEIDDFLSYLDLNNILTP